MLSPLLIYIVATLIVGCFAADQDIITILNQQSGISTFIGLLQGFPKLIDTLNGGTFSGNICHEAVENCTDIRKFWYQTMKR